MNMGKLTICYFDITRGSEGIFSFGDDLAEKEPTFPRSVTVCLEVGRGESLRGSLGSLSLLAAQHPSGESMEPT